MKFEIYQEGFMIQGMDSPARADYVGSAEGKTFIDACKNYIKEHPHCGQADSGPGNHCRGGSAGKSGG